jgi:DNA-binding transcriptional LysR family regulator
VPASDLTPDRLRTFLAAARHLSFTRAAAEVHLSQPAVSRQIAQVEAALGAKLFEQRGKAVHLTDAGRAFVPAAARILGDVERALEIVPALEGGRGGRLRVGASSTPGLYLIPKVLGAFHARWPEVELTYTVANTTRIEELIVRNELDLGFVGAHLAGGELVVTPFARDEVVCAAAARHPLAVRSRRAAPEELGRETLVLGEAGSATRVLFEAWLAAAGGSSGRTVELGSPEAIKAVVAGGFGVGVLPRLALARGSGRGLREVKVAAPPLTRNLSSVRHPSKPVSPAMTAFLRLVEAAVPRGSRGTGPSR